MFAGRTILFAHSDYLQIWLEYGLGGLLLLLGLAAAALLGARSAFRRGLDPLALACGAGLASCFAHAVVDFPLHVPFILCVTGAMLGALARAAREGSGAPALDRAQSASPGMPVRVAVAFFAIALLAQPMLAQMASRYALAAMAGGDVEGGLYWQSVARRLEPRNSTHYWAESVIWRELAKESGDRNQWARADRLLAEGIRANPPYAFNIVLDRARMHRVYADVLDGPATPQQILAWVEGAVAKSPTSIAGQVELARALAFAGRDEEARRVERALRAREPDYPVVQTPADGISR
jgi:hypothetical protein